MNSCLAICTIKHDVMLKKSITKKTMSMCKRIPCRPEVED